MLILPSRFAVADDLIYFDIKKQRADKAIIAFAQETQKTIIFSFDITKKYQANELKGFYSIESGLKRLLNDIGLIAVFNQQDQLSIQLAPKQNAVHEHKTEKQANNSQAVQQHTHTTKKANIERISIIGSRMTDRSVDDLPVAVDILSSEALINTGQTEVGRMLQTIAPSFNFSSSSISDGTDAIRPATLRGLGPDQTLVLVNGKRRHQASLIHINTSVGRGTTGTDINAIPIAAIKRIEVLRDGAAAQYGSDAIAGVINIVLNDFDQGGKIALSYGEYSQGDGATTNLEMNKGFSLFENGFINASLTLKNQDLTNRSGLHGACQYDGCIDLGNNQYLAENPRELNAPRSTFIVGDADTKQVAATLNSAYDFSFGQLYSFLTFSQRDNISATFFRHNNDEGNTKLQDGDAIIPQGFLPQINSYIKDFSYNIGYQVEFNTDSTLDISYTFGKNNIDYKTTDTLNASFANALRFGSSLSADQIRSSTPKKANAYGLELTLQTLNIDFTRDFSYFSLAMGTELRTDEYSVFPGDKYSYFDYDTHKGTSLYPVDLSAGTQGFIGIAPISAVNENRKVISFYTDIEVIITENLLMSSAVRYDKYKGFGDSANFKFAANWTLDEQVALRASISTGFRAPSMQQLYFNNISTQFVTDPNNPQGDQIPLQVGTFRNDSLLASAIGIPQLKEENATNYSLGTVIKLHDNVNLTIDYYSINIEDRIVISDQLGEGLSPILDFALKSSGVSAGQFFLNGADTQTKGIDIITTWHQQLPLGTLDMTFAANFTNTEVTNLFTPPGSGLGDIPPEDIFSAQDISIIEQWQPRDRVSITSLYKSGNFAANLSFNRYGEYTITDGGTQTFGAELLTNIRLQYQINRHISINLGGNNIFDVYPDKNKISNSRAGTIVDNQGNTIVDSSGVFTYSRRSAPFGFNGAYYYAGVEYIF